MIESCILHIEGTWGDVQPYLDLVRGLIKKGYPVVICTGDTFSSFQKRPPFSFEQEGVLIVARNVTFRPQVTRCF